MSPTSNPKDNKLFYKGDFRDPEQASGFWNVASKTLAIGAVGAYLYRGVRGAGWFPLRGEFWKPLSQVQRSNIASSFWKSGLTKDIARESVIPSTGALSRDVFKTSMSAAIEKEATRGFGLRTMKEGVTDLFSRTIEGIPQAFEYLGFPKRMIRATEAVPRWILGGKLSQPGFAKASAEYQARIVGRSFVGGVKPITPFGSVGSGLKKTLGKYLPRTFPEEATRQYMPGIRTYMGARAKVGAGIRSGRYTPKHGKELLGRVSQRFKPGRATAFPIPSSPSHVMKRIMTRVVLPAFVASTAFNYADYRIRRSKLMDETPLREGITGGAATMWAKSRMFMQNVLEKTGVLNLNKYMEDLAPGYLKVAGMVFGAVWGMKSGGVKGAQKATQALTRAFAGGVAGYAVGQGLKHTPEELEKIYSGEKKMPVKRGRWWEFGRCCLPTTPVRHNLTSFKKAKDINVGDIVLSVDGKLNRVKDVIKRKVEDYEFCLSITTSFNRVMPAEVTDNHPLLVLRRPCRGWFSGKEKYNIDFNWENAGTLRVGDYLAFPVPIFNKEEEKLLGFDADNDLGFLLGHFLAEGNLNKRNGKSRGVEFCCGLNEKEYLEKDKEVLENIFGNKFNITKREDCGVYGLRPCGKDIAIFFESLFYVNGDKEIPESFFSLPDNFLEGFLHGYYCGDGHLEGNNKCITSKRLQLLIFFQLYLLSIGQTSTIVKHGSGDYDSYRLIISSDKCGRDLFIRDGLLFSKITSISNVEYSGEVIDFEIEDGHSFCTAGFVLHNTPFEGGRTQYYRPHWYPLMMSRYKEKGSLYPSEDWKWQNHWLVGRLTGHKQDPYAWEKLNYKERPYPVTSQPFDDVPLIGPYLNWAFGGLVKPQKFMHAEEWMGSGGIKQQPNASEKVRHVPTDAAERLGLKGIERGGMGEVVAPNDLKNLIGEQQYRFTEFFGLPGFLLQEELRSLTGKESLFETTRLQTSSRATGFERNYWDRDLGGLVGTCFIAGSRVKTYDGIKYIEDVANGDLVLSKGKYRKVVHAIRKRPNNNFVKIESIGSGVELTCTNNHYIPVVRRHEYDCGHKKPFASGSYDFKDIQAKEIRKGDFLLYQIESEEKNFVIDLCKTGKSYTDNFVYKRATEGQVRAIEAIENNVDISRKELGDIGIQDNDAKEALYKSRHNISADRVNRYIIVDEDVAYAIGWYLAEGCQDGTHLDYTMHAREENYAIKILSIFKKLGYNGKIRIKDNTLRLRIYSSQLAKYFSYFGDGAKNKRIPPDFKKLPRNILKNLIDGLILGDGWDKGFTTVSEQLARDVFDCLLSLNIHSYLYLNYKELGNGCYPQGASRKDTIRHYISFREGRYAWKFFEGCYLVPVSSAEEIDCNNSIVYDLEIEDIHYYTVDGVLVHNTEIFRRFFPHRRRQVEEYNPIANAMGERHPWIPGSDYFIDFKHGDPYIKVPLGEARLPGTGYEALNELHSNIPGVYDAMDRFQILADVAPYSEQYKHYRAIVGMWAKSGALDKKWKEKYKETLGQRKARMSRYDFTPKRFSKIKKQVNEALTSDNETKKEEGQYNAIERGIGRAWESATHFLANAPIPGVSLLASKLLPARDPIEHYERFQVLGRESASWSHPGRDFAKVYAQEIRGIIDPDYVPSEVTKRWDIEEYFDRLKYVKYKQLESISEERGDFELARDFEKKQQATMFGLNPYKSWANIYRAMPARERDYFQSFKEAEGAERERIRGMISPDMKRIYEAQWGIADLGRGVESDAIHYQRRSDEELSEFFDEKHLPGPNWIGWHPDVDLDKVKLKVVKNEAMDIHDFNLWESQEREMEGEPIPNIPEYDRPNPEYTTPLMRKQILERLLGDGITDASVEIEQVPSNKRTVNMDLDISYDQSDRYIRAAAGRSLVTA